MSVAHRREREREERRDEILDAAQRCFLQHGFDAVKMGDVAAEAELGKGTLYLYFHTKEALMLGVAVRHQQRLLQRFDALVARADDGLTLLRGLLLSYGEHLTTPPEHLKLVMSRWAAGRRFDAEGECGEQMRENIGRLFHTMVEAFRRGQRDGSIATDVDPPSAAMALWAAVNGALLVELQSACLPAALPALSSMPNLSATVDFLLRTVASPLSPGGQR